LPTRAGVPLSLRTIRTKTHKMTVDLQSGALGIQASLRSAIDSRPDDVRPNPAQVGMG